MTAAAGTVYSDRFDSTTNVPINGRPFAAPIGQNHDWVSHTIATTSLDFAADRVILLPMPHGAWLTRVSFECADLDSHATPTLDADLVWSDGTTDTIIYNAGTAFQAAIAVTVIHPFVRVTASAGRDYASIDFKVNTAAATAQAGAIKLVADWAFSPA